MKIAMLGTRGIPASYSGFETCVEELGARLAARGHAVTVYCRSHHIHYAGPYYRGMRLVKLPTIANKYFDTLAHTFLSCLHALTQGYDVGLMFIAGNSPVSFIPRLAGQKVVLNVDGLDWKRKKWPPLAKKYIQFAEYLATKLPNAVVTDSHIIQNYYRDKFGAETTYIAYGATVLSVPPGQYLARFGLAPRRYVLFVGRLVPENCAHHLVEAFRGLDTDLRCVIVGDAPYADAYIQELKASAGAQVVFTGYLFGEGYRELSSNAFAFVETSEVGGTHPALLEAMAFGNCVVVNDTPENLETVGEAGLSYRGEAGAAGLREVLKCLLDAPSQVETYRRLALARIAREYDWDRVTDQYEALFERIIGAGSSRP
jgi:glycosyltransferase involved in cell wall biosynthesis